ncbi:NADH-quinone oxidoreductase subunit G [Sulfurospirillum sp. 1612]|uniref:NADH-quinone oxidoreductase subunit G n=1 Tax=Sulfurospirillum sp. 1612 TaxID=3094835 RepID=UPI002F946842
MSDITITIDGIKCAAKEGEYVLQIARRNNIFIPAMCYLTNCSPTLACRLCLVEIDGKRAYSCNAKAKDGMNVTTKNEEIETERKAIMRVYDLNHPLECGVCDQSGECELQNYTLEMGVDSQHFAIADTSRPTHDWGFIHYDSSLCIVCERCVTVCKDMIGDAALKTVPRGGAVLDKEWKESTPKDTYAMWNKLQKSLIGIASGAESLDCTNCGECTAVCPVGALVGSDFQYKSNAWELTKIPASNPHSSDCSLMYYDVKHSSIKDPNPKIYRVNSDFNFAPLHGGIRYGYDFQNDATGKDEKAFAKAVAFLQEADTIAFDSFITNEEALILQRLKEKFGYKLINEDALSYKKFLEGFRAMSGKSLYGADLNKIRSSNFIISVGSAFKTDNPNVGYAINNALTMNKGAGIYFHPIPDSVVEGYSKNFMSVNHKVGVEESILYLILDLFADKEKLPQDIITYLEQFHQKQTKTITEVVKEQVSERVKDEESGEEKEVVKTISKNVEKEIEVIHNTLLDHIGMEADFTDKLEKLLAKKDRFSLVAGEDLYNHPQSSNLSKLLGLIQRITPFEVLLIPSKTNTLGVSLICDLDEEKGKQVLGYNVKGDVTLSALGNGDLDMPALNQQEGTFTSMNKRVVPTNVAVPFKGYCLNDIANALGMRAKYTIDYTKELGTIPLYQSAEFDDLPNEFDNSGYENRGYLLAEEDCEVTAETIAPIEAVDFESSTVIYLANPVMQFSPFTNKAHQLNEAGALYVSSEFLEQHDLKSGSMVLITNGDVKLIVATKLDHQIKGLIPYLPTFDTKLDVMPFFADGYRFSKVTIKGAEK